MSVYPYQSRRRTSEQHLHSPLRRTIDKHNASSRLTDLRQNTKNLLSLFDASIRRMWRRLRPRQTVLLLLILCCVAITLTILQPTPPELNQYRINPDNLRSQSQHEPLSQFTSSHPMGSLISKSQNEFEEMRKKQSTTLKEAVTEYRHRYGIPPPPNFDKWYKFAMESGVQLIDEFDIIHQSLTPFWGLAPSTIRARAREALGYNNNLIGVLVRHGNITKIDGGSEWMQDALEGMTKKFVQYLPNMDLCFNIHDEPRVIQQHDDLARLVANAIDVAMPAANAVQTPRNQFSQHPTDMKDGSRIEEFKGTRFNRMNYQASWTHSRLSCSPSSASRSLEEDPQDDVDSYAINPLGFVYNHTAFSDICNSPSFKNSYGFFAGPNAFSVVQDLFPVFSQSKISTFQDILYPSPWYWYGKVTYNETLDMDWHEKEDKMYWRGSTTGGYSRDGGWRRQHRQRFVSKVNAADTAKILESSGNDGSSTTWTTKDVFRPDFADIFDVKFSEIGQCDPGDCRAQKEYFTVVPKAAQTDAYQSKYLLDIDGNAFSGRFYAFLQSRSLIYKLAVFREWHTEFIKPWVHYVPLSLKGEEWIESVRWFTGVDEGKREAERIAAASSDWASKALRNVDIEVWFFRLLLEYGRVIDDDREIIGFSV